MTMVKKSISEVGSVNAIGRMWRIVGGEDLQINLV
jgi:hypothetical protein